VRGMRTIKVCKKCTFTVSDKQIEETGKCGRCGNNTFNEYEVKEE
jgi:predicted Zn-ribbon and HTH transcriptional regulator